MRSLVVSPNNAELFYLGTSDGQIFRSTDGAQTWHRLRPGIERPGLSIDSIAIDPRDPKTIYVGAWAVNHNQEGGVFKSQDGGQSWKLLKPTAGLSVRSVALAPSDPKIILAGTSNNDDKLNGVFRSTDGGQSWERISPEGDKEIRNIESIAVHPTDPNIVYIGTWHLPWKTTDGGRTWKQTGYKAAGMIDDSDIFGISINRDDPETVYMNACSGIYRSTNGGQKWTKLPGIPFSARRTYALLPHPTNPNVIFAGTSQGLWRSTDGGMRWRLLTSKNVVVRAIAAHPDKPDRIIIGTDDFGVLASNDLGEQFTEANRGFINRHILAILPDIAERGRILISVFHDGAAGGVFLSTDGGQSWEPSWNGLGDLDVFTFHQLPDDPNIIYAGTSRGVYRSDDRGASWRFLGVKREPPPPKPKTKRGARPKQTKPKQLPPEPATPPMYELTKQVDAITSFTDEQGRHCLLAATMDGLYRTSDETKGWEKILIGDYDPMGRVFSVSIHRDRPRTILAGTRQGLYVSHDGGATWEHIERGPTEDSVLSIAQDPSNPDIIIVGTNRFVYRSTNGGRSFVLRGGGLPSGDFTSVSFNPMNPNEVIAAEYMTGGIYRSMDKGLSWERIDAELPSRRVWTIAFDPFQPSRIFAGSFSSGVYVLTIYSHGYGKTEP